MLSDLIRARLRELGREASRAPFARPITQVVPSQPWQRSIDSVAAPTDFWRERGEEVTNGGGKHWRIRHDLSDFWPRAVEILERWHVLHSGDETDFGDPSLAALARHFPSRVLFLDLETCGFAGSAIFLAGLVRQHADGLVIEQLFARTYAEEQAVLASLWQHVEATGALVTFNGKTFDWPMVRDRTARHRMMQSRPNMSIAPGESTSPTRKTTEPLHVDLLHAARRRWKPFLPNCRLQTLEQYVCRRHRRGDLSGSLVPAAYQAFVRTGESEQIGAILHHNALDLVTLVEIAVRLMAH